MTEGGLLQIHHIVSLEIRTDIDSVPACLQAGGGGGAYLDLAR